MVVDDGRRFLDASTQTYDVIVIDPPPPPQSPGTSLLYSREFYQVIRQHLSKGGILEEWLFDDKGDPAIKASTAKSLTESFPYVRAFPAVSGQGIYFLASMEPIPATPASVLASRMPPSAVSDFVEWGPTKTATDQFDYVLSRELKLDQLIAQAPQVPALRDDAPINEYFLLRRFLHYYR